MSIPVEIADLAAALEDFGAGYLLTVSTSAGVKAVTVEPTLEGGALLVRAPGRGTLANLAAHEAVTVLFPPREPRGHSLLVDGTATACGDTGEDVRVEPTGAVLHRPADHADGPPAPGAGGCGHDCAPVT